VRRKGITGDQRHLAGGGTATVSQEGILGVKPQNQWQMKRVNWARFHREAFVQKIVAEVLLCTGGKLDTGGRDVRDIARHREEGFKRTQSGTCRWSTKVGVVKKRTGGKAEGGVKLMVIVCERTWGNDWPSTDRNPKSHSKDGPTKGPA